MAVRPRYVRSLHDPLHDPSNLELTVWGLDLWFAEHYHDRYDSRDTERKLWVGAGDGVTQLASAVPEQAVASRSIVILTRRDELTDPAATLDLTLAEGNATGISDTI